ncbi:hypothetical protein ACKWTF_014170 [Chironomus riparius]
MNIVLIISLLLSIISIAHQETPTEISCNIVQGTFRTCEVTTCPNYIERNTKSMFSGLQSNNWDVKEFWVIHKVFYYLPTGIDQTFSNLKHLKVYNSKMQEITSENLKPFQYLEILDLSFNEIERLDQDLFSNSKLLRTIWLNNNRIVYIQMKTFTSLKSLEFLSLTSNVCYNKEFRSKFEANSLIEANKCTSSIDQLYVLTSKAFKENQQNGETKTKCLEQSCDLKAITTQIEKVSTTLITLEDRLSCRRGASIKSCFDDSIKTSEEVLTKALDSIKSNVVDVIKQEISNIKGTCKECETQATNNQDKLSKGQSTNSQKSKESSLNNTFEAYDKYITILCLVILILMNAIALCCNCCKVNLLETSKDLNKSQSDHQNMQNNTKLRIEEQNEASNYSQRQENHYEVEGNYNEVNMIADAADVAEDLYSEVKIELQNNDEYEGDEQLYSTVMK